MVRPIFLREEHDAVGANTRALHQEDENPRIWVQLGCSKTSREFLRAPRVAIGAVKLPTVTSGRSVTAEVASSSLVVPAILNRSGPETWVTQWTAPFGLHP